MRTGSCGFCSCGASPTRGIPPATAIRLCEMIPVLVFARRGGCDGRGSSFAIPFFTRGKERLPSRAENESCTLDVERRGKSGCDAPGPCMTVVSDTKLADTLLAGEVGAVRWAGFLATGGGALFLPPCCWAPAGFGPTGGLGVTLFTGFRFGWVEPAAGLAAGARPMPVCLRGGGGGGVPSCEPFLSSLICSLPTLAGRADGSYGGGSFRGPELDAEDESNVEWFTCSYGEVDMLEKDERRDSDLGTLTQSGSSVGTWGFVGRFGLRIV